MAQASLPSQRTVRARASCADGRLWRRRWASVSLAAPAAVLVVTSCCGVTRFAAILTNCYLRRPHRAVSEGV